jgi:hypothetical protein
MRAIQKVLKRTCGEQNVVEASGTRSKKMFGGAALLRPQNYFISVWKRCDVDQKDPANQIPV